MNIWIIVPLLAALVVIGIFVLNQTELVNFDKMNTPLAKTLVVISFVVVFVFVIWFVLQMFPLPGR